MSHGIPLCGRADSRLPRSSFLVCRRAPNAAQRKPLQGPDVEKQHYSLAGEIGKGVQVAPPTPLSSHVPGGSQSIFPRQISSGLGLCLGGPLWRHARLLGHRGRAVPLRKCMHLTSSVRKEESKRIYVCVLMYFLIFQKPLIDQNLMKMMPLGFGGNRTSGCNFLSTVYNIM